MASYLMQELRPFFTKLAQKRPFAFPPHARLIVGVSGGPDSLALLHILQTLYSPGDLLVAHLNHQLRPSAAAEAQFVCDTAVSWHIACHIKEVDIAQLADAQNLSLEEAGRWARYRYFAQLAAAEGVRVVSVAHHADDQAETVLMHILRGSGLSGLRGMLPIAPLPSAEEYLLIRPFLHTTRAEIEAYCQEQKLQPILDESNADTRFLRNRLRHELLPYLADYNPQIKTHLQQLATTVAADYELVEAALQDGWTAVLHSQTPDTVQLKRVAWLALPLSLQRRTLRRAVYQLRPSLPDVGFLSIEQACEVCQKGHTGAHSSLPGNLTLTIGYQHIILTSDPQPTATDLPQLLDDQPRTLLIPGEMPLTNGWQLIATQTDSASWPHIQNNDDPWTVYIHVDGATELVVRGREPGEGLRPLGMKGQTVKLKDLMINRKMPARLRARWPLLVHNGQVIWVVGHHLDEQVQIEPEMTHIVKVQCQLA